MTDLVELQWRWAARLVLLLIGVSMFWFFLSRLEAKGPSFVVGVFGIAGVACLGLFVESLVFCLTADARGIHLRSMLGPKQATWSDVVEVYFERTTRDARYYIREASANPADSRLVLITKHWRWSFHRWTHDLEPLIELIKARRLVSANPSKAFAKTLSETDNPIRRVNDAIQPIAIGLHIVKAGMIFVFTLLVAGGVAASTFGSFAVFFITVIALGASFWAFMRWVKRRRAQQLSAAPLYIEDALMAAGSFNFALSIFVALGPKVIQDKALISPWIDRGALLLALFLMWSAYTSFREYVEAIEIRAR